MEYFLNETTAVSIDSDTPSISSILFKKNVYYYFSRKFKRKHFVLYLLIKLLNKRYGIASVIRSLLLLNKYDKKILYVVHDKAYPEIIMQHMTSDMFNDCDIIALPYNNKKIESFLSKLNVERLISSFSDFSYKGKIVFINRVEKKLFVIFKKRYPNAEILNYFIDYIPSVYESSDCDPNNIINELGFLKGYGISLYSYNKLEASKYNIGYRPNQVNFDFLKSICNNINGVLYDVVFIGACYDQVRLNKLIYLVNLLRRANLSYYFVIYASSLSLAKIRILDESLLNDSNILFDRLPYEECLRITSRATTVIDLYRISTDEGYSFRIPEAVAMNKKIITDRKLITCEQFYDGNMILYSDVMNLTEEHLINFVSKPKTEYINSAKSMFELDMKIF